MRLALMQPYLFPYIGYFQLMAAVDKFVCYDDVNFIKQGWINRNRLLCQDKAQFFSVPIRDRSSFRPINQTEIATEPGDWPTAMVKRFESCYRKAPHFSSVFPILEEVFTSPPRLISELAIRSIKVVQKHLGISTSFVETSAGYENSHLRGQERVLSICLREKATIYINPPGGKELYSPQAFAEHDIAFKLIQTRPIGYPQFTDGFQSNLSIVDVMMFNSVDRVREYLKEYDLI